MLRVTDERARELKETWLSARRAAFALGPKYEKNEVENRALRRQELEEQAFEEGEGRSA